MWCVVPAAGRATRLGGRTGGRPKALLEVGGRSLAERLLARLGPVARDVCFVTGPGDDALERALGRRRLGVRLHYAVQPRPDGVAGAVAAAEDLVRGAFAVVMGDSYYESDLGPALERWRASGVPGAVLVEPAGAAAGPVGVVRLRGDRVTSVAKRPAPSSGQAAGDGWTARVCGMFMLPAYAFGFVRRVAPGPTGERELEDAVQAMIDEGTEFLAVRYRGWRRNLNAPRDLAAVARRLRRTDGG